jgi:AcrR family transcriptional regulator
MDLYLEEGFEQTTVAEIAARAGLTERTFFRYFTDKREVLFWGAPALQDLLVAAVVTAPAEDSPITAVASAIVVAGEFFQEGHAFSRRRQSIIAANPDLQERELIKLATLAGAMADALRQRGVTDPAATLAAEAGVAVFRIVFDQWVSDETPRRFSDLVRDSFDELRDVTAG